MSSAIVVQSADVGPEKSTGMTSIAGSGLEYSQVLLADGVAVAESDRSASLDCDAAVMYSESALNSISLPPVPARVTSSFELSTGHDSHFTAGALPSFMQSPAGSSSWK